MEITVSWNPLLKCSTECIISAQDPAMKGNDNVIHVQLQLSWLSKLLVFQSPS